MNLKSYITDYPDFPEPGILFRDISPLLADPEAFGELIFRMEQSLYSAPFDTLIGIDARGFIFASALARSLNKRFVMARKKGKLPGNTLSGEYSYEYASAGIELQQGMLSQENTVVVVDDVLATGNTLATVAKLAADTGASVSALLVAIELKPLNGRDVIKSAGVSAPVYSTITYE